MKLNFVLSLLSPLVTGAVAAHDTGSGSSHGTSSAVADPAHSLDKLLTTLEIPKHWTAKEQTILEEGRVILTPKTNSKGSLWLVDPVKLGSDFTIEWTIRSVNYEGASAGGLSLWFISSDYTKDKSLYDGPATYNGLQVLVDNNSPLGQSVRGVLSDGSAKVSTDSVHNSAFASCLMGYQGTSVPLTMRLSYTESLPATGRSQLKLQVDNRVCFQTDKIILPKDGASNNGAYHIGITADNAKTPESFEVLRMQYFDSLVEEALAPNTKEMAQPRMIAKIIDESTGKEKLVEKQVLDEKNDHTSNYMLFQKLDKMEGKILANDISELQEKLQQIMKNQYTMVEQLNSVLEKLQNKAKSDGDKPSGNNKEFDRNNEEYKQFFAMNEKLGKLMDERDQLREANKQQESMRSATNAVTTDEIVSKLAVWLVPLIGIMFVMAYYTFKIRQEITKAKLL